MLKNCTKTGSINFKSTLPQHLGETNILSVSNREIRNLGKFKGLLEQKRGYVFINNVRAVCKIPRLRQIIQKKAICLIKKIYAST